MKIGIFDPYMDTPSGGEKYMMTAASFLSKKHEVSLFWDDTDALPYCAKRFDLDLSKVTTVKNIFAPGVSLWERLQATKAYDVLFYLSDGSIPLSFAKKVILHVQFPLEWVNGKTLLNQLKLRRVHKIVCNSFFTKTFVDKTFGVKSIVLYPPASGHYPQYDMKNKKQNMILTVGRFGVLSEGKTFKKHEILIDAFAQMVDEGLKQWKLVIVTSVYEKDKAVFEKFKEKAKGYPIEFLVNVSSKDLYTSYKDAKIYWHASGFGEDLQKHPELAEHFGISTVEAMEQHAVPVVIAAGGQPEIVTNGENGFLWNTLEELKNQTKALIANHKSLEKIATAAQVRAKDFSVARFCDTLQEIIEK